MTRDTPHIFAATTAKVAIASSLVVLGVVLLTSAAPGAADSPRIAVVRPHGISPRSTRTAAIRVPGTGDLNVNSGDNVLLSCTSAGGCAAAGTENGASGKSQAYVANRVGGTWQSAVEIPGVVALQRAGGGSWVFTLSCAAPGDCAVGGVYASAPHTNQPFVASEVSGTWKRAIEVPGIAALEGAGGGAEVDSVSCGAPGDCTAVGTYQTTYSQSSWLTQAYVSDEVKGVWRKAIEIPGFAAFNTLGQATVTSVSCAAAGSCVVGGSYGGAARIRAFVADEVAGTWQKPIQVPGTEPFNVTGKSQVSIVSCAAAGDCVAAGYDQSSQDQGEAFVADEVNGTWQKAIAVPGTQALNVDGDGGAIALSCPAVGSCTVGGNVVDGSEIYHPFVDDEVGGVWRTAIEVPGVAEDIPEAMDSVDSLSCAAPGDCVAGGTYDSGNYQTPYYDTAYSATSSPALTQAFVSDEVNGVWHRATEIPGLAVLDVGPMAVLSAVSCGAVGACVAGGSYEDAAHHYRAFVDTL